MKIIWQNEVWWVDMSVTVIVDKLVFLWIFYRWDFICELYFGQLSVNELWCIVFDGVS